MINRNREPHSPAHFRSRTRPISGQFFWLLAILGPLLLGLLGGSPLAAEPVIAGYQEYEAFRQAVLDLRGRSGVGVESLAETGEGRDVWLITIGAAEDDAAQKPALLLLGNVAAPQLVGSELALRMAERFSTAELDESARELLDRFTLYIIPRPNPDGSQAFFQQPWRERDGNARLTDDDRDGEWGEDPPEDLNQDGYITMMRVEDPTGEFLPHPEDERVMIRAKPEQGEQGVWSLYTEGTDTDGDGEFNEDAGDGVSFNRNFTFDYPYFKPGAGPHQVSEPETRAVADFAFAHPNIVAVFAFAPQGNLVRPWKVNKSTEQQRIKTSLLSDDEPYMDHFSKLYRQLIEREDSYDEVPAAGDFARWGYFHYGRWSLAARGWWIPEAKDAVKDDTATDAGKEQPATDPESAESTEDTSATPRPQYISPRASPAVDDPTEESDATNPDDEQAGEGDTSRTATEENQTNTNSAKKIEPGDRGGAELRALAWFAQQGIDGFIPWQPYDHPDFPRKRVEIGGFKPFMQLNPPADQLDPLAQQHAEFILKVLEDFPRLEFQKTEVTSLGGGLFRVRVVVVNQGYLPTVSEMGRISRQPFPLELRLIVPEEGEVITGPHRVRLDPLRGLGGNQEHVWIVRLPDDVTEIRAELISPTVGQATATLPVEREEQR